MAKARSRALDLQKELHSDHLPSLAKCLPISLESPGPYGVSSLRKHETLQRPCYRESMEKSERCLDRGMHSFYNVMWDPHVRRGPSSRTFQQDAVERCESIRKAKNETRRKKIKLQPRKVGGICPWPPEVPEPKHLQLKWDKFLVEYLAEVKFDEESTQTPESCDLPKCSKRPFREGVDASTQIHPCDLFDMGELMGLINETIVEKISEQAISEVMEEEEIAALTTLENEMHEKELLKRTKLVRLRERKQLELVEARKIEEEAVEKSVGEAELAEVSRLVHQNCFSRVTVATIKERLLAGLGKMGYLIDCVQLNIESRFIPWLNHMVLGEIELRGISNEVLDDILSAVTLGRVNDIVNTLAESLHGDRYDRGLTTSLDEDTEVILAQLVTSIKTLTN